MCFLNKLLLLAVLGWLFQVGGVRVQIGKMGRDDCGWRWGECLSLIEVGPEDEGSEEGWELV